jgi:tetratricopeptide (TPR) repeat protein
MYSKNPSFNPDVVLKQAISLHQSGKFDEATSLYRKLLNFSPNNPQVLTNLGAIALQQGKTEEGIKLLGESLKVSPNQPIALINHGMALQDLKRFNEALESYDLLIALKPDFADAYIKRGNTLRDLKRFEEALTSYDQAIALQPDNAETHINRGNTLQDLKRFEEALTSYGRAIALKPDIVEIYNNCGNALRDLERIEEALANYDRAIALKPDFADTYYNRGNVLRDLKRFEEALADYDRAIAFKPDFAKAYWNKAILKILVGDYEEGWRLFEWRWKSLENIDVRNFHQPLWLGEQPVDNKTILIYQEQGLGDAIQFCRYAPMVEALGAKVIIEVSTPLVSLVSTLKGNFIIIEKGQPLPHFDLQCPVMSLPLAFKTSVPTIPAEMPYLYTNPDKQNLWHERLGNKARLRIGLVWSGSAIHGNDHNRSIPLKLFEPLFNLPIEMHSLQKEMRADDQVDLSNYDQIHFHQDNLKDFSDTAALIQEMDLVISVDTSVAHLAGAIGKTVWILLPFMPDYRWMLDRTDSPWYPSATLFRQPEVGDWSGVILEVTKKLLHQTEDTSRTVMPRA